MYNNNQTDATKNPQEDKKICVRDYLATLDDDVFDKVMNAKTGGGRSLNAIWSSSLPPLHKLLLSYIGSQMSFDKNFENQYRYISLNKMAEETGINRRTVIRILNGDIRKNGETGLVNMGYVKKIVSSKEDQKNGHANFYCLTSKIFDEYILKIIEKNKHVKTNDNLKSRRYGVQAPCDPRSPPTMTDGHTLVTQGHYPSDPGTLPLVTHGHSSSFQKIPSKIPVCVDPAREAAPPANTHIENQGQENRKPKTAKPPAANQPPIARQKPKQEQVLNKRDLAATFLDMTNKLLDRYQPAQKKAFERYEDVEDGIITPLLAATKLDLNTLRKKIVELANLDDAEKWIDKTRITTLNFKNAVMSFCLKNGQTSGLDDEKEKIKNQRIQDYVDLQVKKYEKDEEMFLKESTEERLRLAIEFKNRYLGGLK